MHRFFFLFPGLYGSYLEQVCFRFSALFRPVVREAIFNHPFRPQESSSSFFPAYSKFLICGRLDVFTALFL